MRPLCKLHAGPAKYELWRPVDARAARGLRVHELRAAYVWPTRTARTRVVRAAFGPARVWPVHCLRPTYEMPAGMSCAAHAWPRLALSGVQGQ